MESEQDVDSEAYVGLDWFPRRSCLASRLMSAVREVPRGSAIDREQLWVKEASVIAKRSERDSSRADGPGQYRDRYYICNPVLQKEPTPQIGIDSRLFGLAEAQGRGGSRREWTGKDAPARRRNRRLELQRKQSIKRPLEQARSVLKGLVLIGWWYSPWRLMRQSGYCPTPPSWTAA